MSDQKSAGLMKKKCKPPDAEDVIRGLAREKLKLRLLKEIADQVFQIKYEHLRKVLNGKAAVSRAFDSSLRTKLQPTARELAQIYGNQDDKFETLRGEIMNECEKFPEFALRNHLAEFTGAQAHYMAQRLALRVDEGAARSAVAALNLADITMAEALSLGEATFVEDVVPIPPEHLLRSTGQPGAVRWLIQGHAGSGKTTLTRRLAGAAARVNCVPLWASLASWSQRREELIDHWARWLFLKRLGRKPTRRAGDGEGLAFFAEAVEQWLRQGKAAVLLDGLDEVPADDQETALQRIRTVAALGPGCPMLVTSRYGGFVEALASRLGGAVRQMDLMPIEWNEVVPFLNHHLPAERAHKLASDLRRHPQMRGVSGNPFFLNLGAFVFARNGFELPDSLVKIYEFALAELLRVPLERRSPYTRHTTRPDSTTLRKVIRRVAWEAFLAQRTDAIAAGPMLDWILSALRSHWTPQAQRPLAVRVLDEFSQRRILSEVGDGYQFMHLSVQEFLAAEHLNDPESGLDVLGLADRAVWLRRWQLVLQFLAGTASTPDKLAALLDRLLIHGNTESEQLDDFHGRRAWMAGRCLALAPRDSEQWRKVWRAFAEEVDARLWTTWAGAKGDSERLLALITEHPLLAEALPHRYGGGAGLKTTTTILGAPLHAGTTAELARTGDAWVVEQVISRFEQTTSPAERGAWLRALRGTTYPRASERLIEILSGTRSPALSTQAAEALEGTSDYRTTARLVEILESTHHPASVRIEAASALRGTTDPKALRALLKCVARVGGDTGGADAELRLTAARSLKGTTNCLVVSELTALLRSDVKDVLLQRACAQALRGSVDLDPVTALIDCLRDSTDDGVRHAAAEGLFNASSREAVGALTNCLKTDRSATVRLAALSSLHHAIEPDAVTLLTDLLKKDRSAAVRMGAAQALQGTSDGKGVESLLWVLLTPSVSSGEMDELYLTRVVQALRGNRKRPVVETLLRIVLGKLPQGRPYSGLVRAAAAMSLEGNAGMGVMDSLAKQLRVEKDLVVQIALARALYGCGTQLAIHSLAKCLRSSSAELRQAAGRSLRAAMQDEQTYLHIFKLVSRDTSIGGMIPLWPSTYVVWPDFTTSPIESLVGDLR